MKYTITAESANRKLGAGVAAIVSSRDTCPPSCPLMARGCYYQSGFYTRLHWGAMDAGTRGVPFGDILSGLRELSSRPVRYAVGGDLPGIGEDVDVRAVTALAGTLKAAQHRGWTYTHKKSPVAIRTIERVNGSSIRVSGSKGRVGLTINVSADSLPECDGYPTLPTVVTLPTHSPVHDIRTPAGRSVVVCPAQTSDVTCSQCMLCAVPDRRFVIGFLAHGAHKSAIA